MGKCIITQGGGGGISPDDLTASPNDVLKGKIAGVNGYDEPVEGTLELTGTATNDKVLSGYTYYNTDAQSKQTGSISSKAAQTYYATTSDQTINAGQYLSGAQTIKKLSQTNLSASNIKTGVTVKVNNGNADVYSVTGTFCSDATLASAANLVSGQIAYGKSGTKYTGTMATLAGGTYTPRSSTQTISCSGKKMTSNIVINGDSNLISANIVYGKSIFGVSGSARKHASYSTSGTSAVGTKSFTSATNKSCSAAYIKVPAVDFTPVAFWVYSWNDSTSADTFQFGSEKVRFDKGNPYLGGDDAERHVLASLMSKSGFDCPICSSPKGWMVTIYGYY